MSKTLYFLIGPKGSGKTFIGTHVHENSDIYFLRVEPIWVALQKNEDGWQKVLDAIHHVFTTHENVMIENLGAGEGFVHFLSILQRRYRTKLIKVSADLPLCYKRVQERNKHDHIPVSDDKLHEYNAIASKVSLNWDLIVENNGRQDIETITENIKNLSTNIIWQC